MIWQNRAIYLLVLPAVVYYVLFKYIPIYGLQLAFKKFSYGAGIAESPWVGLSNFQYLFQQPAFWDALRNTVTLSLLKLVFSFPTPLMLALLINELRAPRLRRSLQVIYTFPHFLSWIVLSGIFLNLFGSTGMINNVAARLGGAKLNILTNPYAFRAMLIYTGIWKEAGWGTIVYIATIAAIDSSLYEAAKVDGANRAQRIRHIIWPAILPVTITMMILRIGNILNAGFDQVFNLYNVVVYPTSDILDTYIYRLSFQTSVGFGVSTAVGLFKGATNAALLVSANFIARSMGQKGIA